MLKKYFVEHLPFLGKYKRYWVALYNSLLPAKSSYSQHQEDIVFWEILKDYNHSDSIFIDVGANHPTDISNTYLLYRKGLKGIIIEPNEELVSLFRKFRKRDTPLMIGCSNEVAVLSFNISKTPVVSSFSNEREVNTYRTVYLPVLPLDTVLQNIQYGFISLLSIDVEGLNYQVLQGAQKTLDRVLLLCVEYDTEEEKKQIEQLLGARFELKGDIGCNLLYLNKELQHKYKK